MKNIFLALLLMIGLSFGTKAQIKKAELIASGLTCSMCSFAIEKSLSQLSFIDSITTDLDHTTYILHFNTVKVVDINQIKKKVEDAGFSIASLILFINTQAIVLDEKSSFNYHHFKFSIDSKLDSNQTKIKTKVLKKGFLSNKEFKKYKKKIDSEDDNSFHLKLL
jgi:copper chaperone CopZ